jgi:ADP-ribose pyrophosphatase YjhB (NUDIX family)
LELSETAEDGAKREAMEEAGADINIQALLAIYNISRVSLVQLIYRAALVSPDIEAGLESREVALFTMNEIPWDEIAFPSVIWALRHHEAVLGQSVFAPFNNPEGDMGAYNPGKAVER